MKNQNNRKNNNLAYLKVVLNLLRYKSGKTGKELLLKMNELLGTDSPKYLLENGRTAEYIFLKSLNLPQNSEVIVQGFTCNAVINPILWLGLKPVYVDIDSKTLNLNIDDLKAKISRKTKVIIIQHTFGNAFDVDSIRKLASDSNILILEDCAHSLGISYKDRKLGTFGDAAIFSFGIEKVLSTRVGGLLMINNLELKSNVDTIYNSLSSVSVLDTFLWLMNPIIWRFLRIFGGMKGAELLVKLNLLNMGFYKCELKGVMPSKYPRKLSNALSKVIMLSLLEIDEIHDIRLENSKIYTNKLKGLDILDIAQFKNVSSNVRFPVILKSEEAKKNIIFKIEKLGYSVGTWYCPVIYPGSTNLDSMLYNEGTCPIAEDVSKRIINLPTGKNISIGDARKITEMIIDNA